MNKLIIIALIAFVTTVQAKPTYISSNGKSVYTEATQSEYEALSSQERYQAVFTNATKEEYDAMVTAKVTKKTTQTKTSKRVINERVINVTNELQQRDGIVFLPNENIPFTGRLEEFYPNGQKKREVHWKNGSISGVSIWWYENGRKKADQNNSNRNMTAWYENGQKKYEIVGSNPFTENTWYENGQKAQGLNDKNKLVNWDSNGKEISSEEYTKRFK